MVLHGQGRAVRPLVATRKLGDTISALTSLLHAQDAHGSARVRTSGETVAIACGERPCHATPPARWADRSLPAPGSHGLFVSSARSAAQLLSTPPAGTLLLGWVQDVVITAVFSIKDKDLSIADKQAVLRAFNKVV